MLCDIGLSVALFFIPALRKYTPKSEDCDFTWMCRYEMLLFLCANELGVPEDFDGVRVSCIALCCYQSSIIICVFQEADM